MEPAAFGEFFAYLAQHFSAQAYDEGSSFLSDGLDKNYLSENVTVTEDVRNMRFNQRIITALGKCEFSNSQQRTGDYWFSLVVPATKIEGFTFSSGTHF